MGALLGAIITASIAIYIMNRTNINNRIQEKKKVINEFLNESRFLLYSVENLIRHVDVYAKYQKEEEMIKRTDTGPEPNSELSKIRHAKGLNETDIVDFLRKIKNVNRNAFTGNTFDIYLDILSIAEGQIEYFWQRSLEKNVNGVGDILEDATNELNALKVALEQKYEEKQKEFNSL